MIRIIIVINLKLIRLNIESMQYTNVSSGSASPQSISVSTSLIRKIPETDTAALTLPLQGVRQPTRRERLLPEARVSDLSYLIMNFFPYSLPSAHMRSPLYGMLTQSLPGGITRSGSLSSVFAVLFTSG